MNREQLEGRATQLGLPWDQSTTDDELVALIRRAETEGSLEAIVAVNSPPCKGLWWDVPSSEHCPECLDQAECFEATATTGIDAVLAKPPFNGDPDFDPSILGVEMSIGEEGIAALVARRVELGWKYSGPTAEPEKAAPETVEAEDGQQWILEPPKKAPPKKAPPKKRAAPRPTPAGSAQTAADPARPKMETAPVCAAPAEAPVGDLAETTCDSPGATRRKQSKLVALLRPGDTLEREYKGKLYRCQVVPGGFQVDGETYKTLNLATQAIVGTITCPKQRRGRRRPAGTRTVAAYSAPRFWNLEAQLKRLRGQATS